ncbi:MAG: hypothetical protein GY926_04265, partial [bacterium]|nr:hypothetical protein [bacterium]
MSDELDDFIRQAITQTVDEARSPRPFSALPRDGRQNRKQWFEMGFNSQRFAFAAAITAIALLIGGLAVVAFGADRTTIESGPANTGPALASETTEPTEPTVETTTTVPTTTIAPAT